MTIEGSAATATTTKMAPPPASSTKDSVKAFERIYVGGLDPFSAGVGSISGGRGGGGGLKPSDVVERLQSFCQANNIRIVSINNVKKNDDKNISSGGDIDSSSSSSSSDDDGGEKDIDKLDSRPFVHINAVLLRDNEKHDDESDNSESNGEKQRHEGDDCDNTNRRRKRTTATKPNLNKKLTPTSALSVIAKQFHNIKWKGCKLRVEPAKPHFLQRLEDERKERMLLLQQEQQQMEEDRQEKLQEQQQPHAPQQVLPRKLRVRKRHGDEAVHVDTKPWEVDNWQNFQRARTKLQKWAEKEKQQPQRSRDSKNKQQHPNQRRQKPLLQPTVHRAVHIRFSEYDEGEDCEERHEDGDDNFSSASSSASSSSLVVSSESESESEADSEQRHNHRLADTKKIEKCEQRFVWSDDDGDDNGGGDDGEEEMKRNDGGSIDQVEDTTGSDRVSHNDDDDDDDTSTGRNDLEDDRMIVDQVVEKSKESVALATSEHPQKGKNDTYEWSSDDDDDDASSNSGVVVGRESSSNNKPESVELKCTTKFVDFTDKAETVALTRGNDEFMAGFDEDDEEDDDDDDSEGDSLDDENIQKLNNDDDGTIQANLVSDVSNNLNVLASIFPDMSNQKPATLTMEEENVNGYSGDEDGGSTKDGHARSKQNDQFSDGFGLMPRYDPTSASSQKYVLEEDMKASDGKQETDEKIEDEDKKNTEEELVGDNDVPSENKGSEPTDGATDKVESNDIDEPERTAAADASHIYQEVKLEGVFREARDAWQSHTTAAASATSSGGGGFSFGFDLGGIDNRQSNLGGSRQPDIDIDTPSTRRNAGKDLDIVETTIDSSHQQVASKQNEGDIVDSMMTTDHDSQQQQQHRRRGLLMPEVDLMQQVDRFFSFNNGEDVSIDPVAYYSRNKQDQEDWKKERLALTLDWKRKRKLACSRQNKNSKRRR